MKSDIHALININNNVYKDIIFQLVLILILINHYKDV